MAGGVQALNFHAMTTLPLYPHCYMGQREQLGEMLVGVTDQYWFKLSIKGKAPYWLTLSHLLFFACLAITFTGGVDIWELNSSASE